jgi:hypothetical protein
MARQGQDAASHRVERVRKQIDRWRSKKWRQTAPMPRWLWNEACLLAREVGVHRIKCALGLNYESLKKRVGEVAAGGSAPGKTPGFVELRGAQLLGPARGAVVEVSDADGGRLTVQLGTGSELDVAGLIEAFWRRA